MLTTSIIMATIVMLTTTIIVSTTTIIISTTSSSVKALLTHAGRLFQAHYMHLQRETTDHMGCCG
jgi:hypothetical protein